MNNKEYNQYKINLIFENWRKYLVNEIVANPRASLDKMSYEQVVNMINDPNITPERKRFLMNYLEKRDERETKAGYQQVLQKVDQEEKEDEEKRKVKVLEDQFKVSYDRLKMIYNRFRNWAYQNSNRPVVPGELLKTYPLMVKSARILTSSVNEENLKKLMSSEAEFRSEGWVLDKARQVAGLNASSRDAIVGAYPLAGGWAEYGRDLENIIWNKIGIHIPVLDPTLDRAELHSMWENSKFKIFVVLLQFGADIFLDLESLCMLILTILAGIIAGPLGVAALGTVVEAQKVTRIVLKLKRLHEILTFQGKARKVAKKNPLKTLRREYDLFDEVYLAVERAGKKFAEKINNLFSSGTPAAPIRVDLRTGGFTRNLAIGKVYNFLQGNDLLVAAVRGMLSEFVEAAEKEFEKIKM